MKTPQLEHGYLKIANSLVEAFCRMDITKHEQRCLFAILRQTYGFNHKEASISISKFMELTGLPKNRVCEAVNGLARRKIVLVKGEIRQPRVYALNKAFESWVMGSKNNPFIFRKNGLPVPKIRNMSSENSDSLIVKDNNKDILKNIAPSAHSSECSEICKEVFKKGLNIYAMLNRLKKELNPRAGAFPDEVVIRVCREYLRLKPGIKADWPWFIASFKMVSAAYFSEQNEKEGQVFKKEPLAIKDILGAIAKRQGGESNG